MVKNKTKKIKKRVSKSSKKKTSSKLVLKKPAPKKIRQDFEVFAKGVKRLEELKTELDSLNVSGYDAEVNSIRSKLKNVSYIPEIEKEMRILKSKLRGTYSGGKVESNGHNKIHKKIKELEKEMDKRQKISRKVNALEDEVKNKRTKKQLSKKEVKLVKGIPKIENQMNVLKKVIVNQQEEEQRKKAILKHIDPSVNLLVNNKFDMSLNEIKAELSKKLKEKQLDVQKQLQNDLELRKKNFELQYDGLENRFENKYKEKVADSLQREIKNRFNDLLKQKVAELEKEIKKQANESLMLKRKKLDLEQKKKLRELEIEKNKIKRELVLKSSRSLQTEGERLNSLLNVKDLAELGKQKKFVNSKFELKFNKQFKGLKLKQKTLEDKLNLKYSIRLQELEKKELDFKERVVEDSSEKFRKQLEIEKKKFKSLLERQNSLGLDKVQKKLKDELEKKIKIRMRNNLENEFKMRKELQDRKFADAEEDFRKKFNDYIKQSLASKKVLLEKQKQEVLREVTEKQFRLAELIRKEKQRELLAHQKELSLGVSRNQLNKLKEQLLKETRTKKENVQKEYELRINDEKERLRKRTQDYLFANRVRMNNQMHEHLTSEVKKLHLEHDKKLKTEENEINRVKQRLENEQGVFSRLRNSFDVRARKLKEDEKKYREEVFKKAEQAKQGAIQVAVSEQSIKIKNELRKDFNEKLKLEIKAKEADFEKKKADLALDVQRKAKQLFN